MEIYLLDDLLAGCTLDAGECAVGVFTDQATVEFDLMRLTLFGD